MYRINIYIIHVSIIKYENKYNELSYSMHFSPSNTFFSYIRKTKKKFKKKIEEMTALKNQNTIFFVC